jgi:NHL repeat
VVATNAAGTTTGDDTTFTTRVSFLIQIGSFGGAGTTAGLFQTPIGVAVDQGGGKVFVVDSANARVQRFNKKGQFKSAWGWGVKDGTAESQVCKTRSNCLAGISGAGAGQFTFPTSIAVDSAKNSPSRGDVYVGDAGTNVVQKFNRGGKYLATIDGSTAPQGHFVAVVGVAVDQNGHLWVADAGTNNVVEFDALGTFVQQWSPGYAMQAIVVDSANNAVYLINGSGGTDRFPLSGASPTPVDPSGGTALALDPLTGNLYVNHGNNVVIYDAAGTHIDSLFSLGAITNSHGIAYYATGKGNSAGKKDRLFVTDSANNLVAIYGPPAAGAPFITAQSSQGAGKTSKIVNAWIIPRGHKTTCTFQYVTATDFAMTGYANAQSVPCTPDTLGSSFTQQKATATLTGLTIGTTYHFRVVAMSSGGTTTGDDQTFQAGPGLWTPFTRCPVDDPAMLATDGAILSSICVASNSTHGSIQIGGLPPTITGNSNLQGGLVADLNAGILTFIAAPGGSLIADPATVTAGGVTVIATVESAGTPTEFDLLAGISVGMPILRLPVKIHLVGQTVDLGPSCFIGSEADPIVLHPANTDVSNAMLDFQMFDADGTPNPNGAFGSLVVTGTTQGDSSFAVPEASGCGPNGDGSLNAVVNSVVGLPSPAGNNTLVLEDASSALALPNNGQTGAEFAAAWHSAFD